MRLDITIYKVYHTYNTRGVFSENDDIFLSRAYNIHIYVKHINRNERDTKNDDGRCERWFRSESKIDAIRRLHVPTIARVRVFRQVSDFPLNSIFESALVTNSHTATSSSSG